MYLNFDVLAIILWHDMIMNERNKKEIKHLSCHLTISLLGWRKLMVSSCGLANSNRFTLECNLYRFFASILCAWLLVHSWVRLWKEFSHVHMCLHQHGEDLRPRVTTSYFYCSINANSSPQLGFLVMVLFLCTHFCWITRKILVIHALNAYD